MFKSKFTPYFNADLGSEGGQATGEPGATETFTIDGVEYTPDQLKEFISKGKDYTKKTQDLARQRQEIETQKQSFEKLSQYSKFIDSLEADPNLTQQVANVVQSYMSSKQTGTTPTQAQINTIKDAAENTESDEMRQTLEDMRLDMEIAKLSNKYEDFDEQAVLDYAMQENIDDLEKAYKLLNYDAHQQKAAKKALEDAKKGATVPRTQTGNTGSSPGSNPTKPKTFTEAANAAMEYLRSRRE